MIVLFWNIRGLGNDPSRNMLAEIQRVYKPDIVAIAEPKILRSNLRARFWRKLNLTFLDENAREGGLRPNLWIVYNSNLLAIPTVVYKDDQLMVIKIITSKGVLHYGFVHAANLYVVRRRLWMAILELRLNNICFMGDFNAIFGPDEQFSQCCLSRVSCDEFRQCVLDAGLIDLETTGPFLTWRCSHSSRILMSRLDRALASEDFISFWNSVSVLVLPRVHSDHHPLILKCQEGPAEVLKPFRFQNFWTSHKEYVNVVSESRNYFMPARDPISMCIRKLKRLKVRLKEWNTQTFGNIFVRLEVQRQELVQVQSRDHSLSEEAEHMTKEKELMMEINEILKQQHQLLLQKSRATWLVDGDRNTAFFHRVLRVSRAKSDLSSIMIDGVLCEDATLISNHIQEFYKSLFTEDRTVDNAQVFIRELISSSVNWDQN